MIYNIGSRVVNNYLVSGYGSFETDKLASVGMYC